MYVPVSIWAEGSRVPNMETRKTLIVYREELLGPSETFIRAQGESLERFRAFYLGFQRVPGLTSA